MSKFNLLNLIVGFVNQMRHVTFDIERNADQDMLLKSLHLVYFYVTDKFKELVDEINRLTGELADTRQELSEAFGERNEAIEEAQGWKRQLDELKNGYTALSKLYNKLEQDKHDTMARNATYSRANAELETELRSVNMANRELLDQVNKLNAELNNRREG